MIDPTKYTYRLVVETEKGEKYDITKLVEDLGWEELENELASRLSCKSKNDKTSKGRLSSIAKPGCYLYLQYRYKSGSAKEAIRGRIVEWNPSSNADSQSLGLKAYDNLYDLQESEDYIYYPSGSSTKQIISDFFSKWSIKLSKYNGPNIVHGVIKEDKKKLGSIIKEILDEARKKGGGEAVIRSVQGNTQILSVGSNKDIYCFLENKNVTSTSHKISIAGMVTRVKILGEENDDGRRPIEATVDGKTKYGIRQKIIIRGTNESIAEAQKEAKEVLKEEGIPEETIKISAPDVPVIRKGDIVYVKMCTGSGFCQVLSISHDCDKMEMKMSLKKTTINSNNENQNGNKKSFSVGDVVNFHGGEHYVSSDAKNPASVGLNPGPAKIEYTNPGSAHPWCLVTEDWEKTHVWGWVDEGTFD